MNQLRQAIRLFLRKPASTVMPILVLTLGIGATTAIFSIIDAALLRPVPGVSTPSKLVLLQRVQDGQVLGNFGYPDFVDYRQQSHLMSGIAAAGRASFNYVHGEATERISGAVVSGNYFSVLGVVPSAGRLIDSQDETGRLDNVVLSYNLWQHDFAGSPTAVGQAIQLNGHPFTVIGVASPSFTGTTIGSPVDVWLPITTQSTAPPYLYNRAAGWLTVFGRLGADVTLGQAQSELVSIASVLGQNYPNTNAHRTLTLYAGIGMDPDAKARLSRFLELLLGSVSLLLLIACGNVSSLLLARNAGRRRELALRVALGAGRSHLLAQLLTEAIVIAGSACLLALLVASEVSPLILSWQPGTSGLQHLDVSPDWRVFLFAAMVSVVTACLCTVAPIWQAGKVDLVSSLKQGTAGAGNQTTVFRNALVVCQVMLSVVLLIGSGLVIRTMHHLLTTDEGFETRRIAIAAVDLTSNNYTAESGRVFYDQLLQRVQNAGGVVSASLADTVPPSEISTRQAIFYPGQQPPDIQGHEFDPQNLRVDTNSVGPAYFQTMGIALLRGRDFTLQDRAGTPAVAIINDRLAERLWPGEDAIGKRLAVPEFAGIADPNVEIIGVARSTKNRSLLQPPQPILYLPFLQRYGRGRTTLIVRTAGDPGVTIPRIVQQIHELDRNVPVFGIETMSEHVGTSLWQQQIAAGLIGLFGVLAAILASIGLYGIIANGIAERTREIGIRLALGSPVSTIRMMILKQSFALVAIGLTLGIVFAFGVTGFLESLLYEISPHDSWTFAAVCAVLSIVAYIATEIPIRRAIRIDPVRALRQD